jgi:hypothetical protein
LNSCRPRHEIFELAFAPIDDALKLRRERLGFLHLVEQARIAQRELDASFRHRVGEFLGAQQRHRGNRHSAGLDDAQIAGDRHRRIRRAKQHAVSRNKAEIARQHVGDAVDARRELRVGPCLIG